MPGPAEVYAWARTSTSVKPAAATSGTIRRISHGSYTTISITAAAQLCSGSAASRAKVIVA